MLHPTILDGCQSFHRIGIASHHVNQQRGLGVWFGATLLPVFERANVGAQVNGKEGARQFQLLADAQQLRGRHFGSGLELRNVRAQRTFPAARLCKRRHALA